MENKSLQLSLRLALLMGIFLPLAETMRRSNQLLDPARFLNWFDDYLLGGALLLAVYVCSQAEAAQCGGVVDCCVGHRRRRAVLEFYRAV